jgi:hypothetical protein
MLIQRYSRVERRQASVESVARLGIPAASAACLSLARWTAVGRAPWGRAEHADKLGDQRSTHASPSPISISSACCSGGPSSSSMHHRRAGLGVLFCSINPCSLRDASGVAASIRGHQAVARADMRAAADSSVSPKSIQSNQPKRPRRPTPP